MTWGVDAAKPWRMPGVGRLLCPGCPVDDSHPAGLDTSVPHCCGWPSILQRYLSRTVVPSSIEMLNLAVPATSTAWLSEMVTGMKRSLPGGPLSHCDIAVLDYSVNDANGGGLYDDDEEAVVAAITQVHDKLWPTPMLLVQTYPYNSRRDKANGAEASAAHFSYARAYARALTLRDTPFLNLSAVIHGAGSPLERQMAKSWPHPTWEQHSMLALMMAWALSSVAGCAASQHATSATSQQSECEKLLIGGSSNDATQAKRRQAVATADSCDRGSESALLTAVSVHTKSKERSSGDSNALGCPKALALAGWQVIQQQVPVPNPADSLERHGAKCPTTRAHAGAHAGGQTWRLFEDRPAKPGWIINAADTTSPCSMRLSFKLDGEQSVTKRKSAAVAPWMAFGMVPLRATIGFMKTYGKDAGVFVVRYCGAVIGRVDTRWSQAVSLVAHATFKLPPCPQPAKSMKLRSQGTAQKFGVLHIEATRRVKIVSVAMCPEIVVA